ncbi:MAG: sugar-binding domain-containing protein [Bacillota bacterium]|nr:sugar-binding domain-containing protein [Bacillota bacterium]
MKENKILNLLNIVAPEVKEIMLKRYNLLKIIKDYQPIGRRILANEIGETERKIRSEIDDLRKLELIIVETNGMFISKKGENLIEDLEELSYKIKGLKDIESNLKDKLGIKDVFIVEGDSSNNNMVFKDLGKKTAKVAERLIKEDMKIAIMGGTTMAVVADQMEKKKYPDNLLVLPGRGGLGESMDIQANSIASKLAKKLGAKYKLLHVPDNIRPDILEALKTNPQIKDILNDLKKVNLLLFGLGRSEDMALRRKLPEVTRDELKIKNACAEALGFYFDDNGEPIMHSTSVGIALDDLNKIENAVCAAAGTKKAKAIYAFSKYYKNYILVTDEVTAKEILKQK